MKMEPVIANRIFRNVILSILLYALPVVLMFLSFYITGERPWEKTTKADKSVHSSRLTVHRER